MPTTRRKLTTILSADVQGYSRLMGDDEEGTLATLKQYRDAMARLIEAHAGRVVNTWGDGLIAEFPSVVEAVRAAVDVQNELAGQNADRSAETRMLFRIGINLGDVITEGDDIYGDGVNIAARLQASAEPGGIVISNTVYDQVRNKMPVGFEYLGPLAVKNIEEAVPSYAVRIGDQGNNFVETSRNAGQNPSPPAATWTPEPAGTSLAGKRPVDWKIGVLVLVALALVAINLLSWSGTFWSKWPVLAVAAFAGLSWARATNHLDRGLATLGVIGAGIAGINLLGWHGNFWAIWPLLGIAFAAGIRWITRQGANSQTGR